MVARPLARLRRICLALPEAHEVEAWGEPTFRVRNKLFAMYASSGTHHGAGRPAVWFKAGPGNQQLMVGSEPERYFVPFYVGPSGWIGAWLDGDADWPEIAELMRDAWQLIAPARPARPPRPAGSSPARKRPAVARRSSASRRKSQD